MEEINIYEEIIQIFEKKFEEREKIFIKELIYDNDLFPYNFDNIKALIKHLMRIGKLKRIDTGDTKFENYIVRWVSEVKLELPKPRKYEFKEVRTCITLPSFNIFGLTDFLKKKQIKMNLLTDEFGKIFSSAKEIIKICSPFIEWNGFIYFKDVLIKKAKEKVKIQILSREINKKENIVRYNDVKRIYEYFRDNYLEQQLEVRNYYFKTEDNKLASSIHAKLIISDNNKAYIGSGEIRENSFKKNLELGLVVLGKKVKELVLIFDNIFSKSEVIQFE